MRKLNNHDVHKRYQNRLEEDVEFTMVRVDIRG